MARPPISLAEFEAFFRDNLPVEVARPGRTELVSPPEHIARWQPILANRGWAAPRWPTKWGGAGFSELEQLHFDLARVRAGAPNQDPFAHSLVGPVLNVFGTEAQKAEHIPPMLEGTRLWCQGFSEPGSGSDLASVRTSAVLDGKDYVINGQKIWTSYAHHADWIFLLVRTDADAAKHQGLSFLLVDMRTPGIEVRPIISIDGEHHLNEVFLDDVRTPAANLIGKPGQGWEITKFLLNNEHVSVAELPAMRSFFTRLTAALVDQKFGDERLIDMPSFRLAMAELATELTAVEALLLRIIGLADSSSKEAHVLGSMLKIKATQLQQDLSDLLMQALGDTSVILSAHGGDALHDSAQVAAEFLFRRASTIYGGTTEVQRGIIARHHFGF